MRGLVEASFTMRNLGSAEEAFDVWFPLAASVRYPGMLPLISKTTVQDFKVWVDGLPTDTEQVKAPDVSDPQVESDWARFPITFPAGQDVIVHVNYTIYPSGRRPFGGFEYILQTGAGWKDTIGQAVVTVYLPDTVTPENVSQSGTSVEGLPLAPQPAGYTIQNNTIRWQFTDLEPTAEDNIFVDVLEPGRYRSLVQARANAQNTPDSVDVQLELAAAIQNAVFVVKGLGHHGGGKNLGEQANVAYRRALELAPQRAEIYSQYARWMMSTGGWVSLMRDGICLPELCDVVRRGLEISPNDPDLLELDAEIRMLQEEAAPYATQAALDRTATAEAAAAGAAATQTAYAQATQTASTQATRQAEANLPTATPLPSPTPGVTVQPTLPASAPQEPAGVCQAALQPLAILSIVLLPAWLRRRAA